MGAPGVPFVLLAAAMSTTPDVDPAHTLGYELAKIELERQVGRMRDLRAVAAPVAASALAAAAFIAPKAIDRIKDASSVDEAVWASATIAVIGLLGALIFAVLALMPRAAFTEALDSEHVYTGKLLPVEGEPRRAYARLIGLHHQVRNANSVHVDAVADAVTVAGLCAVVELVGLLLTLFLPL